jgi:hypothetical protein
MNDNHVGVTTIEDLTRQLYTPRRHVDGSRANTSREREVDDAILSPLQNVGEEKHQERGKKDEDLL